jgi:hypothetical protein
MLRVISGAARVQRTPVDVALRVRRSSGVVAAALDLGPRFTIQQTEGVGIMRSMRTIRLETGVRIAARVEIWP